MARDHKYGQVTFEHGNIPDDEPGVWFRGRDKHLPQLLEYYSGLCQADSPDHHLELIDESADIILQYQIDNGSVTPTSDHYVARKQHEG